MALMTFYEDIILYLHRNPDGIPPLHATYRGQESIITLPDCPLTRSSEGFVALPGTLPNDRHREEL